MIRARAWMWVYEIARFLEISSLRQYALRQFLMAALKSGRELRRERGNRIEWTIIAAGLSLALAVLVCAKCSQGQTVPAPVFAQPQPQSAILIPRPARFPWVRYSVFGWPQRFDVYTPVGAPFQATVQPVMPVGVR